VGSVEHSPSGFDPARPGFSHRNCVLFNKSVSSHAWSHKGSTTSPSSTEFPVITRRTRSSILCRVVGLIVCVGCECGMRMWWGWCVCLHVHGQMLWLHPDERHSKNNGSKKLYQLMGLFQKWAVMSSHPRQQPSQCPCHQPRVIGNFIWHVSSAISAAT
jgi:hypothetical protein